MAESLRVRMLSVVRAALDPLLGPAEFEADVGYPGAPVSRDAPGGQTPRRLLNAYARDAAFREFAVGDDVRRWISRLLDCPEPCLSQAHHNCVMTKFPGYSSRTDWHQDIRYWRFDAQTLVSAWLALGPENRDNGSLRVIPGSHAMNIDRGRLDQHLFLRKELAANRELIDRSVTIVLEPGDVLFFHCRLFHAAGRNTTEAVKFSPVFTYHCADNQPIPGTRSAQYPEIALGAGRTRGD